VFDAQYLLSDSDPVSVYSPWLGRGGDNLLATLDIIESTSNGLIKVEVYSKNSETAGDGVDASKDATTAINISPSAGATGPQSKTWNSEAILADNGTVGLLELVRYRITVTSNDGNLARVLFRMLDPVWFDTVDAS